MQGRDTRVNARVGLVEPSAGHGEIKPLARRCLISRVLILACA